MKRIVWLASYPKSGNTWFRAFLANLLCERDEPVNINNLHTGNIASARGPLDAALGYDSTNLTHDEIDLLRPELYLRQAQLSESTLYLKVHDAYLSAPNGRPLFPPEATKGIIYLVRNPIDVCVSFARHSGRSDYGKFVKVLGNPSNAIAARPGRLHEQLRQRTLSWSGHVMSWIDAVDQNVHIVRYEDMKLKTEETFTKAAVFADLPSQPEKIRKAIEFSSFEVLREQERKFGFREKLHANEAFFRQGAIGGGMASLSLEQIEQICFDHKEVMQRLGYL